MPPADCDCVLVNVKSGYARTNRSWVLGRLVRDHEKDPLKGGLTVTFYKTCRNDKGRTQGIPTVDWVYCCGIAVILVQLGIAVIPGAVGQDWTILTVTAIGTVLALFGGALPKWKKEKWNGRKSEKENDRTVVCLTRGNGYSDALVIISEGMGQYRLEDLANARTAPVPRTIWCALILFIGQILLLLAVAGLNDHAWYLLAIGALGIVQNAIVAGIPRDTGTTGIHLEQEGDPIHDTKVMKALQSAENREEYVGISLLPIFFPGGLRPDEEKWRDDTIRRYALGCGSSSRAEELSPASSGETVVDSTQSPPEK